MPNTELLKSSTKTKPALGSNIELLEEISKDISSDASQLPPIISSLAEVVRESELLPHSEDESLERYPGNNDIQQLPSRASSQSTLLYIRAVQSLALAITAVQFLNMAKARAQSFVCVCEDYPNPLSNKTKLEQQICVNYRETKYLMTYDDKKVPIDPQCLLDCGVTLENCNNRTFYNGLLGEIYNPNGVWDLAGRIYYGCNETFYQCHSAVVNCIYNIVLDAITQNSDELSNNYIYIYVALGIIAAGALGFVGYSLYKDRYDNHNYSNVLNADLESSRPFARGDAVQNTVGANGGYGATGSSTVSSLVTSPAVRSPIYGSARTLPVAPGIGIVVSQVNDETPASPTNTGRR